MKIIFQGDNHQNCLLFRLLQKQHFRFTQKKTYLNNEAGSNEDDKGFSEEIRKVTQQTSVVTAGSTGQEMEKRRERFTKA